MLFNGTILFRSYYWRVVWRVRDGLLADQQGVRQVKIILPLSVTIPRKTKADKVFILNLNVYRNTHHMTLNQAKIAWKDVVGRALAGIENVGYCQFKFVYTVYAASGRKFDLGNVLSVVQKFTDYALIEYGVIPDDNYKIIPIIVYRFGGVDKENPRVELEIYPLDDFEDLPF